MAKRSKFPTILDETLTLSITDLKKDGYLQDNQYQVGTLSWSLRGKDAGSISVITNLDTDTHYVELDYSHNGDPVNYKIYLTELNSNIGNGRIKFFLCPVSGKRCRKLWLHDKEGRFVHRSAIKGAFYRMEIQSKSNRASFKLHRIFRSADKIHQECNKPYFMKFYNGKPTLKLRRLLTINAQLRSMFP